MVRARWTAVGIAVAVLSAGSTLDTIPGYAAPDGRPSMAGGLSGVSPSPSQTVSPAAGESVGASFAYLAARANGSNPGQVVTGANPAAPSGFGAVDPRGPAPPLGSSAQQVAPTFNSPGTATTPPSIPAAAPVAAPYGVATGPTGSGATGPVAQGPAYAAANPGGRGGPTMPAPVSNTGAPGTAAGPSPALAGVTSGTMSLTSAGGGSSSGVSRIIPNLPATPTGARILNIAQSQLGARYTWAGTSPSTGFDCSGFVYWVFNTIGFPIDRTLPEQLAAGRRVRLEELRPGDVLFFSDTYTSGLSHNGVYVGDGKFVHASDESTGVVTTPINSAYWEQRLAAAVRILD